jgi:hypothetical protein
MLMAGGSKGGDDGDDAATKASNEVILEGVDGAFGRWHCCGGGCRAGRAGSQFPLCGGTVSTLQNIRCRGDADGARGCKPVA